MPSIPDGPVALRQTVVMEHAGRMVEIDKDVLDIARQLSEIDPALRVRALANGEGYVVYHRTIEGDRTTDRLVLTAEDLDGRVLERVRYIGSADYDFVKEFERANELARKAKRDKNRERLEEAHEQAFHGARKILGINRRISVPKDPT